MSKDEIIPAAHYLPALKRGRPSLYRKFLERQSDMFPAELIAAHYGGLPPNAAEAQLARSANGQQPITAASFFDLRRSSTADQSGLPDFSRFPEQV